MKLFAKLAMQKLLGDQHLVYRLRDNGAVALSFDDGPNEGCTPKVLDILRQHDVKATFFLVGSQLERYPDLARKVLADGHAVGMHTYFHARRDHLKLEQMKEDMTRNQAAFSSVLGAAPAIFRPPYGRLFLQELRYCMSLGIRTVMWDTNPEDYRKDPPDVLRGRIEGLRLRGGNIILLHDDMPATVEVLPDLIRKVREAGLTFMTVE